MDDRKKAQLDGVITYLDGALTERGVSTADVAACCGVSPEAVRQWRYGTHRPNPENAKKLAARYGLPRHLLRPDLWDPPPGTPSKRRSRSRTGRVQPSIAKPDDSDVGLSAVAA